MPTIREVVSRASVEASAPCRIDMGGTLDLSTFFLPLQHLKPCTFNAALDLRTRVRLSPWQTGKLKISSRGFQSIEVDAHRAPFDHPLGLTMAVATYFQADGVHIDIDSASPPRSALGGSSVAAVALIWAFSKALVKNGLPMPRRSTVALLAHALEQSVAGVPCGLQDQLAAVYGGVNGWYWQADPSQLPYRRVEMVPSPENIQLADHIVVAYCGEPHQSKDVNSTWVRQFINGEKRHVWHEITDCSAGFIGALSRGDVARAQEVMNRETDLRCELTPEVLDQTGMELVKAARDNGCSARFTGAGGGGCVWALGLPDQLTLLRPQWEAILGRQDSAHILAAGIDMDGLL